MHHSIARIKPNVVVQSEFDCNPKRAAFIEPVPSDQTNIIFARTKTTQTFNNRVGSTPSCLHTTLETCVPYADNGLGRNAVLSNIRIIFHDFRQYTAKNAKYDCNIGV